MGETSSSGTRLWVTRIIVAVLLIAIGFAGSQYYNTLQIVGHYKDWKNYLVGTWTDPDFQIKYVFTADGKYEFYDEDSATPAEVGAIKLFRPRENLTKIRFEYVQFDSGASPKSVLVTRDYELYRVDDLSIFISMSDSQDGFPTRLDRVLP